MRTRGARNANDYDTLHIQVSLIKDAWCDGAFIAVLQLLRTKQSFNTQVKPTKTNQLPSLNIQKLKRNHAIRSCVGFKAICKQILLIGVIYSLELVDDRSKRFIYQ